MLSEDATLIGDLLGSRLPSFWKRQLLALRAGDQALDADDRDMIRALWSEYCGRRRFPVDGVVPVPATS